LLRFVQTGSIFLLSRTNLSHIIKPTCFCTGKTIVTLLNIMVKSMFELEKTEIE